MLHYNDMMVVPSFDYCTFIWDSCGQGSKSSLDKLNRHAACIIAGCAVKADKLSTVLLVLSVSMP